MRFLRGAALAAAMTLAFGASCKLLRAGTIHAEYHAGATTSTSTPAKVWSPELWGWYDKNLTAVGPAGAGVVNSGGSGMNAWRVSDRLKQAPDKKPYPNSFYVTDFIPQDLARIATEGWRMRSVIRYVDDFGGERNLGMSAFLNGRAYHMMLDLTTTGDLRATLYDETPRTFQLTAGGAGTAAFHRFQFLGTPGTNVVQFAVDGQVLDRTWDGISLPEHASNVQWGNSDQAGLNTGVADYQEVLFEIGPFTEIYGDFNGDGVTNGQDFLWWQRNVGAIVDLVADANGDGRVDAADLAIWRSNYGHIPGEISANAIVPEPSSVAWTAWLLSTGVICRASQRRSRRRLN